MRFGSWAIRWIRCVDDIARICCKTGALEAFVGFPRPHHIRCRVRNFNTDCVREPHTRITQYGAFVMNIICSIGDVCLNYGVYI